MLNCEGNICQDSAREGPGRRAVRHEVVMWKHISNRSASHQLARFGRVATALFAGVAVALSAFALLASNDENPAALLSSATQRAIEDALDRQLTPAEQEVALQRGWSRAQALYFFKEGGEKAVQPQATSNVRFAADEALRTSTLAVLHKLARSEALSEERSNRGGAAPPTVPSSSSSSLWDFPEIKRYQEASQGTAEEFWDKMHKMQAEHKYSLRWPSGSDGDLLWPSASEGSRRVEIGSDEPRERQEGEEERREEDTRRNEGEGEGGRRGTEYERAPEGGDGVVEGAREREAGGGREQGETEEGGRGGEAGRFEEAGGPREAFGERGGGQGGGFVKAGALLRRGDLMPLTRPYVQWSEGCSEQICPLDTPHKERKYAWKYCMNHFVTNAEKRYCFQAVLSPPVPPPSCPPYPPPPPHTRVLLPPDSDMVGTAGRVRVGASVRVACEEGYRLRGNGNPKCREDARAWEAAGECEPIICANPEAPPHGSVEPAGELEFGEVVRLECEEGYAVAGPSEARCADDGSVGPLGACAEVTCPPYPAAAHAQAAPEGSVAVGEHVAVTCEEGYEMEGGGDDAVCGPEGEWIGAGERCEPVKCPPLTAPEHGTVVGPGREDQVEVGRSVTVECEPGYEPVVADAARSETEQAGGTEAVVTAVGADGRLVEVVCKGDKTFAPAVECAGFCDALAVEHGAVTPAGRVRVGDAVSIECEDWYRLDDCEGGKATCTEERTYDCEAACTLVPSCPPFPAPEHGHATPAGRVRPGAAVHVECDEGYRMEEGAAEEFECRDDGSYGGAMAPECRRIPECPPFAAPRHGSASPTGVPLRVGDQVDVHCDEGYHLGPDSSSVVTCTGTDYDYPDTRCVPLPSCGPYPVVPHGRAEPKGNVTEGHCVEIKCDEGFEMDQQDTMGHERPCCLMDVVAGRLKFQQGKVCLEPPCNICSDKTVCPHCFIGKKAFPAKRREFNFD